MLRTGILVGLLSLFGTILAKDLAPHDGLHYSVPSMNDHILRTKRFGFSVLNEMRQRFCHSFCTSAAETKPYFINIACAVKCPELYLPQGSTTQGTMTTTSSPSGPSPAGPPPVAPSPGAPSPSGPSPECARESFNEESHVKVFAVRSEGIG
ncbi:hypothetical protein P5V15_005108 [Pogonomyrmex californicus]